MEENMILDESVIVEEMKEEIPKEEIQEELPKIQPRKKNRIEYKEKECKVINYNKITNSLDISFDGYGIRFNNVKDFVGDTVIVKYKGEIGKPNFEYKLQCGDAMCKNAYEQVSDRTGKIMIFCKLMGNDANLSQLCVSQKFCTDKDRYVEIDQERDCKYYED